jgi:hypothetical protein
MITNLPPTCHGFGAGSAFFNGESCSSILTMIPTPQNVLALTSPVAVNFFDPAAIQMITSLPSASLLFVINLWHNPMTDREYPAASAQPSWTATLHRQPPSPSGWQ